MNPRNDPMGIEGRTLKNLEYIKDVVDQSPGAGRVHVVAQVVNSLLGLVVLPYEKGYALLNDEKMLEELYAKVDPVSWIGQRWKQARAPLSLMTCPQWLYHVLCYPDHHWDEV